MRRGRSQTGGGDRWREKKKKETEGLAGEKRGARGAKSDETSTVTVGTLT